MLKFGFLGSLGASASFVYEFIPLAPQLEQLVEAEAVGWAVPVEPHDGTIGPEIWFSTALGNDRLNFGPRSELASASLLRLSLDANNQIIMKVLKPDTVIHEIGDWEVPIPASNWESFAELKIEGESLGLNYDLVRIDLRSDDFHFNADALSLFQAAWPEGAVSEHNSRLVVACAELNWRDGLGFTLTFGEIPITVRRYDDVNGEFSDLIDSGFCPLNVVLGRARRAIGRAILEQYDLVLDARNHRIQAISKSGRSLEDPLLKYQLDREFAMGQQSSSWRWIPSPGHVKPGDFIFTDLNSNSANFELLCLLEPCRAKILSSRAKLWIGSPRIEISQSGSVTVSEVVGWEGYKVRYTYDAHVASISVYRVGFRMKLDTEHSEEGKQLEFLPVIGGHDSGEFAIPEWPPLFESSTLVISYLDYEAGEELAPNNNRWYGNPKLEIKSGNRISITAESLELSCDREFKLIATEGAVAYLDFSTRLCRYRQVNLGEPGYLFELVGRSHSYPNELVIQFSRAGDTWENTRLATVSSKGRLWSPSHRWLAAPVLKVDPETWRMTITPSGERGFEYTHKWRAVNGVQTLQFEALPIRLAVTADLSLTDQRWEFVPAASGNSRNTRLSLKQGKWLSRSDDGCLILLFEDVSGPVFTGATSGVYIGIPAAPIDESGRLTVVSNKDARFQFNVESSQTGAHSLTIKFTPTGYSAVGSSPLVIEKTGEECPVCLESFAVSETVAETLCKHRFHLECLSKVIGRRCPYCRGSLDLA